MALKSNSVYHSYSVVTKFFRSTHLAEKQFRWITSITPRIPGTLTPPHVMFLGLLNWSICYTIMPPPQGPFKKCARARYSGNFRPPSPLHTFARSGKLRVKNRVWLCVDEKKAWKKNIDFSFCSFVTKMQSNILVRSFLAWELLQSTVFEVRTLAEVLTDDIAMLDWLLPC